MFVFYLILNPLTYTTLPILTGLPARVTITGVTSLSVDANTGGTAVRLLRTLVDVFTRVWRLLWGERLSVAWKVVETF